MDLLIRKSNMSLTPESAIRLLEMLVNQAAQIVLSPHCYVEDQLTISHVQPTNQVMLDEFQSIL